MLGEQKLGFAEGPPAIAEGTVLRTFYVQKYIFARKMFNKAIAKGYFLFTVFLLVYKANLELARKWISKKKS